MSRGPGRSLAIVALAFILLAGFGLAYDAVNNAALARPELTPPVETPEPLRVEFAGGWSVIIAGSDRDAKVTIAEDADE